MDIGYILLVGVMLSIVAIIVSGTKGVITVWIGIVIWSIYSYNRPRNPNDRLKLKLSKREKAFVRSDLGLGWRDIYQDMGLKKTEFDGVFNDEIKIRNQIMWTTPRQRQLWSNCGGNWTENAVHWAMGDGYSPGCVGYDNTKDAYYRRVVMNKDNSDYIKYKGWVNLKIYSSMYDPNETKYNLPEPQMAKWTSQSLFDDYITYNGEESQLIQRIKGIPYPQLDDYEKQQLNYYTLAQKCSKILESEND